jgi:hypothetical protein
VLVDRVTQRQRFLKTLLGHGADRFPFFDLDPAEDTLKRWHREGFPPGKSFSEYFNLETHHSVGLILRSYPFFKKGAATPFSKRPPIYSMIHLLSADITIPTTHPVMRRVL